MEEDAKYLNENEIMKSEQLLAASFTEDPLPKTAEQIEKEKADMELKRWEKLQKLSNKPGAVAQDSSLSIGNKRYQNIINMGKDKPIEPALNPDDYVEIHV
mmetsp:Transcript_1731/g.1689  ORF Transcript_1731/g.1689 Transcript_1731/m.1689 type:complete len:101 (+) Transcript_1731:134-436(+)